MAAISNDWLKPLEPEFSKEYYKKLYSKVVEEYKTHLIFPPSDEINTAYKLTDKRRRSVLSVSALWYPSISP